MPGTPMVGVAPTLGHVEPLTTAQVPLREVRLMNASVVPDSSLRRKARQRRVQPPVVQFAGSRNRLPHVSTSTERTRPALAAKLGAPAGLPQLRSAELR